MPSALIKRNIDPDCPRTPRCASSGKSVAIHTVAIEIKRPRGRAAAAPKLYHHVQCRCECLPRSRRTASACAAGESCAASMAASTSSGMRPSRSISAALARRSGTSAAALAVNFSRSAFCPAACFQAAPSPRRIDRPSKPCRSAFMLPSLRRASLRRSPAISFLSAQRQAVPHATIARNNAFLVADRAASCEYGARRARRREETPMTFAATLQRLRASLTKSAGTVVFGMEDGTEYPSSD